MRKRYEKTMKFEPIKVYKSYPKEEIIEKESFELLQHLFTVL